MTCSAQVQEAPAAPFNSLVIADLIVHGDIIHVSL